MSKRKLISLFISFSFPLLLFAQTPAWQWGTNSNCGGNDEADVITHDKSGNIYVAGLFSGVMQLDTFTFTSMGGNDIFIAKYDPDGQLIWVKSGGSSANETVSSITTDTTGNVYVTGSFGGHVIYPVMYTDTSYFSDSSIVSNGNMDIYLISYSPNGNIRWLKDYGSEYNDVGKCIIFNNVNNLILAGEFNYGNSSQGILILDNSFFLTSAGSSDLLLCSLNDKGNILWAKRFGNPLGELCRGIDVDNVNNIYMQGMFGSYIHFGNIIINSICTPSVIGDCFVVKFDSTGNALWAKALGGSNSGGSILGSVGTSILSVHPNGNVYLLGGYKDCDLLIQGGGGLPNEYNYQIFLAKFNTNGQYQWVKEMGGYSDFDAGQALYLDKDENSYVTGDFRNAGFFGKDTLVGYGVEDAFIAKYDKLGTEQWAVNMGGSSYDISNGITGTDDGSLYLTGMFQSSSFNYQSHTLTNNGGSDMFLVKLSQTTGINDVSTSSNLVKVFPNPADETVTIQSKENMEGITVYDMVGRIMYQEDLTAQKERTLSTISWSDGLYLLKVCNKNRIPITVKIIVHH